MLAEKMENEFAHLPLNQIDLSDYNARRFEEGMNEDRKAQFEDLIASVKENGVIQPIAVRYKQDGRYEVMAGERRIRACWEIAKQGGNIDRIPAMIYEVDDDTAFDIMTTENLQREDLTPVEKARSFKAALERAGNSNDALKDLSRRFGIKPHAIKFQIALLELPKAVLDAWDKNKITAAHCEALTRLAGETAILEALTECLRNDWSVAKLTEFVKDQKPLLASGLFCKKECETCMSNSSLQGNLFSVQSDKGASCLNPACFKKKQGEFFESKWTQSKASKKFQTKGFRFKEDLTASDLRIIGDEPQERCTNCPEFITVVSVAGTIIKGQEQVCVGAQKCYDDLYSPKEVEKEAQQPATATGDSSEKAASAESTGQTEKKAEVSEEQQAKADKQRSIKRSEQFRDKFFENALPEAIQKNNASGTEAVRMYLITMALVSRTAQDALKSAVKEQGGANVNNTAQMIQAVREMEAAKLLLVMRDMCSEAIMKYCEHNSGSTPVDVRHQIGELMGIDMGKQWVITKGYLDSMTKKEIVNMGEEEGVDLWNCQEIIDYKTEKHAKKGWMSLKKGDLIDCILNSGADLTGRVPQEIIHPPKA